MLFRLHVAHRSPARLFDSVESLRRSRWVAQTRIEREWQRVTDLEPSEVLVAGIQQVIELSVHDGTGYS